MKRVVRTLYKALLRDAADVKHKCPAGVLRVADPINLEVYAPMLGVAPYAYTELADTVATTFSRLFPGLEEAPDDTAVSAEHLADAVRREFRAHVDVPSAQVDKLVDRGFEALNTIGLLRMRQACHSSTTTHSVRVDVDTSHLPLRDPAGGHHFVYRIRIRNEGARVCQLRGRHWQFTEAGGATQEVPRGSPGVVGQNPLLTTGQTFEYHSRAHTADGEATMRGSFQMVYPSTGEEFDVDVGATALSRAAGPWLWDAPALGDGAGGRGRG